MPTNMTNMTIFKSQKYSYFWICNINDVKVIVIDRICTCSKLIFQLGSNKYRTKTGNQKHTAQRREIKTNRVTTKSQNKRKKTENMVISIIPLRKKQLGGVIFGSKLTLNHPSDKKKRRRKG